MRRYMLGTAIVALPVIGLALFFGKPSLTELAPGAASRSPEGAEKSVQNPYGDIGPQKPLTNPPKIVRAVYLTSWSGGNQAKIASVLSLAAQGVVNAVVIDIKDYSGYVGYDTGVPEVSRYGAEEVRIPRINALLKTLHDHNIYAIARLTVFQDPMLAHARPDLAVHDIVKMGTSTAPLLVANTWKDHKGLSWIDPSAEEAWRYNMDIAKDALARGFDEINLDYVRFPSDGAIANMYFPQWDKKTPKHLVIRSFFRYMRDELGDAKISADLFGLSTINRDDLGIGQVIEDAYRYFDFVSPMIYPSHYASGFLGYKNPAQYPYEVVKYSLDRAVARLMDNGVAASSSVSSYSSAADEAPPYRAALRPWLQDFNLGATYTAEMVQKQIQATKDALGEQYRGFMLWNSSNNYSANVQP